MDHTTIYYYLQVDQIFTFDECVICLSGNPNILIVPCGHKCICASCSREIYKEKNEKCPVCRRPIKGVIFINSLKSVKEKFFNFFSRVF